MAVRISSGRSAPMPASVSAPNAITSCASDAGRKCVRNRSWLPVRCRAKRRLRANAAMIHECSALAGNASSHSKTSPNAGHKRHNTISTITSAAASPSEAASDGARDNASSGHAVSTNTTAV